MNLDIFLNKVIFQEDHFTRLKFKCIGYFVGYKAYSSHKDGHLAV